MKIDNRQARYNYEILETFEAGIDLLGPEVKSVREGKVSLNESFVHLRDGQAYLVNAHIHPYQNSLENISPTRSRKLLLHKKEIISLSTKIGTSSLTLVPIALYNKGNIFKLEVGIGKGKKKWDKREAIKKRDIERDIQNTMSSWTWFRIYKIDSGSSPEWQFGDVRIDEKALWKLQAEEEIYFVKDGFKT